MPIPRSTPSSDNSWNAQSNDESMGLPDLEGFSPSNASGQSLPDFDEPDTPTTPVRGRTTIPSPPVDRRAQEAKAEEKHRAAAKQEKARQDHAREERQRELDRQKKETEEVEDYGVDEGQGHEPEAQQEEEQKKPSPKRDQKKSPKDTKGNRKDSSGQDVFIDDKNLTIEPFGSTHGKRRTKEHDYDSRANTRRKAVLVRYGVLGLGAILVFFGVKNAVFPPPEMTPEEVQIIAMQTAGETGFPTDRGEAFAQDFMTAYLTTNTKTSDSVLSYFYNGQIGSKGRLPTNRNLSNSFSQEIVVGPNVYESVPITANSARYTIGAIVKSADSNLDEETAALAVDPVPKWAFYNVNVYYDDEKDTFQITPESPTVIPEPEVGSLEDIPDTAPLGDGVADDELAQRVSSVVYGYLEGYSRSSLLDHSVLDQYVSDPEEESLVNGLDGRYEFSSSSPKDSIDFEAFNDPVTGTVKVLATVDWMERTGDSTEGIETATSTTTSTYVITLVPSGNEETMQYLVSRFQPYYFVPEVPEE